VGPRADLDRCGKSRPHRDLISGPSSRQRGYVQECFLLFYPYLLPSYLLSNNMNIKAYSTIVSSVVLCGCETWSLIFREESGLKLFENKKLGFNMEEASTKWIKRHSEELHDLFLFTKCHASA
jgi:hypothetical protein